MLAFLLPPAVVQSQDVMGDKKTAENEEKVDADPAISHKGSGVPAG